MTFWVICGRLSQRGESTGAGKVGALDWAHKVEAEAVAEFVDPRRDPCARSDEGQSVNAATNIPCRIARVPFVCGGARRVLVLCGGRNTCRARVKVIAHPSGDQGSATQIAVRERSV